MDSYSTKKLVTVASVFVFLFSYVTFAKGKYKELKDTPNSDHTGALALNGCVPPALEVSVPAVDFLKGHFEKVHQHVKTVVTETKEIKNQFCHQIVNLGPDQTNFTQQMKQSALNLALNLYEKSLVSKVEEYNEAQHAEFLRLQDSTGKVALIPKTSLWERTTQRIKTKVAKIVKNKISKKKQEIETDRKVALTWVNHLLDSTQQNFTLLPKIHEILLMESWLLMSPHNRRNFLAHHPDYSHKTFFVSSESFEDPTFTSTLIQSVAEKKDHRIPFDAETFLNENLNEKNFERLVHAKPGHHTLSHHHRKFLKDREKVIKSFCGPTIHS